MAVELRCPECRTKLKLSEEPEQDSEIECSKCGAVFTTDDNRVHAGDGDDKPAKKKKGGGDEDDNKPKKAEEKNQEKKTAAKSDKPKSGEKEPFKRKKRRSKKRKTNPVVMWSVIGGAVVLLGIGVTTLILLGLRKSPTQEMMNYLPDDCEDAFGLNVGHLQKYPEFNKACETQYAKTGFKAAADMFSKALGSETKDTVEYVLEGKGREGGKPDGKLVQALVIRTKVEYDTSLVSKMPGAKEYTANGVKYYTIDDIPDLEYAGGVRVFAATNRLVVFCPIDMPENKFKAMVAGNKDNIENTFFVRAGPLIKAVTRGTAWHIRLYGRGFPQPNGALPPQTGPVLGAKPGAAMGGAKREETPEELFNKEIKDICNGAKGSGYKASVGSREVRGEWVVWYKDSDSASSITKKWKEKEWVKDDEKPAPRWWSTVVAGKSGGGKTAENALKDNLSFRSSGDTFTIRMSLETKTLQSGLSQLVQAFTGVQAPTSGMMGGGAPKSPPPGPGTNPAPGPGPNTQPGQPMPPVPMPMGMGQPMPPGKRRRFVVSRRTGTRLSSS